MIKRKRCSDNVKRNSPSIEAVPTKSDVLSIHMSITDAMCGLYDFIRFPVRSRMCTMPLCVPRAYMDGGKLDNTDTQCMTTSPAVYYV